MHLIPAGIVLEWLLLHVAVAERIQRLSCERRSLNTDTAASILAQEDIFDHVEDMADIIQIVFPLT